MSPGLGQPSCFRSQPVVPRPREVTQSDKSFYKLSQGSNYALCFLVSFPFPSFPSFGENIKQSISFTCASMNGHFSVFATPGCPPKECLPMGWGGRGPQLNPAWVLRALMSLNGPDQPHLELPPTPSAQEPHLSSVLCPKLSPEL